MARTPSGRLEGETARAVHVFRGIPYARAPIAALRWRPPEPMPRWTGTRPARCFGAAAPQTGSATWLVRSILPGASAQDEDCLTLNVWTPAIDARRRPVMVWIHGGAFAIGAGSTRMYDGARLARSGDVVVVTLNYRLGALGFLDLRALRPHDRDAASNLGLRDQIAALRWVREHIEAFGGDPENVTLFGESAGGMSVATLLAAPQARGLFQRAICQSGAAHNVSSPMLAASVAERFLAELGVGHDDPERLRKLPLDRILRAQRATTLGMRLPLGTLTWQPSLDGDLLPETPLDAIGRGAAAGVQLLVGTNLDEWKLFMRGDVRGRRLDHAGLRRRLQRALPGRDTADRPLAERAFETYRDADPDRPDPAPAERWVAFQSDRVFHAPADRLARRRADGTFAYLFSWAPPLLGSRIGACHGLEIPFVFGTLRDGWLRPLLGWTPGALRLSDAMQRAWVAFARCGHPSHDGLPDWPHWDPDARRTLRFDARSGVVERPLEQTLRFWTEVL